VDPVKLVEKIKAESPTFIFDGEKYYIVELDRKLKESDLLAYAKEVLAVSPIDEAEAPEGLVAVTVDGKPMRWELPVVLTWKIDEGSFAGHPAKLAIAKTICLEATEAWNSAAEELGIHNLIHFTEDGSDPVFTFRFENFANPNLYAFAFFPNDTTDKRIVHIGPTTFLTPNSFDAVGVIRHELGHVLGFRHEHIRAGAQVGMTPQQKSQMEQWVVGGIGGDALTDYDSQSVMHYPLNGRGTLDFKLSDADKAGFKKLYTLPTGDVKEFPI